jgi:hypothetical protein
MFKYQRSESIIPNCAMGEHFATRQVNGKLEVIGIGFS